MTAVDNIGSIVVPLSESAAFQQMKFDSITVQAIRCTDCQTKRAYPKLLILEWPRFDQYLKIINIKIICMRDVNLSNKSSPVYVVRI